VDFLAVIRRKTFGFEPGQPTPSPVWDCVATVISSQRREIFLHL